MWPPPSNKRKSPPTSDQSATIEEANRILMAFTDPSKKKARSESTPQVVERSEDALDVLLRLTDETAAKVEELADTNRGLFLKDQELAAKNKELSALKRKLEEYEEKERLHWTSMQQKAEEEIRQARGERDEARAELDNLKKRIEDGAQKIRERHQIAQGVAEEDYCEFASSVRVEGGTEEVNDSSVRGSREECITYQKINLADTRFVEDMEQAVVPRRRVSRNRSSGRLLG